MEYDSEESINIAEQEGKKHNQDYLIVQAKQLLKESKLENHTKTKINFSSNENKTYNYFNSLIKPLEKIKMEYSVDPMDSCIKDNISNTKVYHQLKRVELGYMAEDNTTFNEQEGPSFYDNSLLNPTNQMLVHIKMEYIDHIDLNEGENKQSNLTNQMKQPLEYRKMEYIAKDGISLTKLEHTQSEPNNPLNHLKEPIHSSECNFLTNIEHCEDKQNKSKTKRKLNVISPQKELFSCSQCAYNTQVKANFKRHLHTHCANKLPRHLEFKDKAKKDKFKVHPSYDSRMYKFHCSECNWKSNRSDHVKLHLSHGCIHSKAYVLSCDACNFKTSQKRTYLIHLKEHSAAHKYKCPDCEYKTDRNDRFKFHLNTHSRESRFHCTSCEYKTNHSDNFKLHMDTHMQII